VKDATVADSLGDEQDHGQHAQDQADMIVVPNDMDFLLVYSSVEGIFDRHVCIIVQCT